MKLTRNFDDDEFRCKGKTCGCNHDLVLWTPFVLKLQEARDLARIPFLVESGYRCPVHNLNVGGKADSSHLKGIAADIRAKGNYERFKIVEALIKAGFQRIGIGRSFVHVDMDETKPARLIWLYKAKDRAERREN